MHFGLTGTGPLRASILGQTGALVSNQGPGLLELLYLGRRVPFCLARDEASESIDTWADECTCVYPGTRPLRASILGQKCALVSSQGLGL